MMQKKIVSMYVVIGTIVCMGYGIFLLRSHSSLDMQIRGFWGATAAAALLFFFSVSCCKRRKEIIIITIVVLLCGEGYLRLPPALRTRNINNIVLSRYNYQQYGIYYRHPILHIPIMKPLNNVRMYYNGYEWQHITNSISIRRHDEIRQAPFVFLGDSFVYGHGVAEGETMTHVLEDRVHCTVANLGQQADCPLTEFMRLKYLGLYLQPRTVIFCIDTATDFYDCALSLSRGIDQSYLAIHAARDINYKGSIQKSPYLTAYTARDNPFSRVVYSSRCFRLYQGLVRMSVLRVLSWLNPATGEERREQVIKFTGAIIQKTNELCDTHNIKLYILFQAHDGQVNELPFFKNACETFCKEYDISYLDLATKNPQGYYFLEDDGHYSPEGHVWVVDCLQQFMRRNGRE